MPAVDGRGDSVSASPDEARIVCKISEEVRRADMWSFLADKRKSSKIAKDRMKLLLVSERMNCSTQMITMMQNDFQKTAARYFPVMDTGVTFEIKDHPPTLCICIPLQIKKSSR